MCCEVAVNVTAGAVVGATLGAVGGAVARLIVSGPVGVLGGATVGLIVGSVVGLAMVEGEKNQQGKQEDSLSKKIATLAFAILAVVGTWTVVGLMGFSVTLKSAAIASIAAGGLLVGGLYLLLGRNPSSQNVQSFSAKDIPPATDDDAG